MRAQRVAMPSKTERAGLIGTDCCRLIPNTAEGIDMDVQGTLVRDIERVPLGRVEDVLMGPGTREARWLQIVLELDGGTVLVPAGAATEFAPGELLVPYPADQVAAATHPRGHVLAATDAARLMRHYGFSD